jgi:hypothetical protein
MINFILDIERDSNEIPDLADVADADAFEDLVQNNEDFLATTPNQVTIDEVPDVPDAPEEQTNHMEAGSSGSIPEMVIDRFPTASAGAPIPSMLHGSSAKDLHQDTGVDSLWSPFTSQCDWLFAHWAKMCGPLLLALSDLLAIPEVCTYLYSIFRALIQGLRS